VIKTRHFNGAEDWHWVNQQVGILRVQDTGGIVAYNEDSGELVGACIWDNWTPNSVQCHMISVDTKALLESTFITDVFTHIFIEKGVKLIYGLLRSDNEPALKRAKFFGFNEKTRLENGWSDGVDYVLVELKKEHCRHLPVPVEDFAHG
jgi:hypothetical protein